MSDWVGIGAASEHPKGEKETAERRKKLLSYVDHGMIVARCFRRKETVIEFSKDQDCEIFCEVLLRGALTECQLPYGDNRRVPSEDPREVKSLDLLGVPLKTTNGWQARKEMGFTLLEKQANWELGHFQTRMLNYAKPAYGYDEQTGFVFRSADVLGVEVETEAVERILGIPRGLVSQTSQRETKYDWEAVFADVAAAFYHDTEFESLEARGVQSQIVRMLQDAFERRGLEVPAPDTCKPKARMLLGSLRGKKPK